METIKIVGIRNASFAGSDGKQINGTSYFYTMPDDKTEGVMAGKLFISSDNLAGFTVQPAVNQEVRVVYNRFGKAEDFLPAQGVGKLPETPAEKAAAKG